MTRAWKPSIRKIDSYWRLAFWSAPHWCVELWFEEWSMAVAGLRDLYRAGSVR